MWGTEFFENANRLLERREARAKAAELELAPTPFDVIHRENKLKLLLYRQTSESHPASVRAPILIIPSLINRHYILDLMPGKSLVRFLLDQGFDVAMIDWGTPGDEDRHVTFERYVDSYIHHAIRALCRETHAEQAVLLGYCLGGTMAAIHAALRPENVAGLIALTAPINFHNSGLLSTWCRTRTFDVETLIKACGNAPWHLMQASFQWLKPTLSANRVLHLMRRQADREFIDGSTALDLWANDNVSFPGECYRDFIQQLYRDNGLIEGTLSVGGERVDFSRLACPILNIAASDDHIVPRDASAALRALAAASSDFTDLVTPGGHIGAVISRRATHTLWPQIDHWLKERSNASH